jgi:KDO2-lipid IV(A) lauroyltransferase
VFPTESEREIERRVLQCYRHFLGIVVDSGRFNRRVLGPRAAERYTFELGEDARRLVERGPPCVLATGHLGDWEASAQGLELLGLGPLYAVAKPPKNRPMSIALQDAREARGMHLLPRRGAMQFAATIAEAGASLGLLLDQRARKKPVLAPFFGRPARCDRSAGVLLRRLRVPVLIYACLRGERPLSYRIVCPAVLWPDELAGASPEEIAGRINAVLERMILAHPDQYFWLHDRYRDTPLELPDARAGSAPRADDPDETPPRATSRG